MGAGSVVAYAFFTSTGTGSGNGSVGTATTWKVAGGSVVGTLYPDTTFAGPDQGVVTGASVTNQAASGHQMLNKIVATISGVTTGSVAGEDACTVADFQFNSPGATWTPNGGQTATILPADNLDHGASYTIADLNVAMVDDLTAQDNCQGQTVTVTFDAS
jgi:hypothetical protein